MVHPDCKDGPDEFEDVETFFQIRQDTAFEALADTHRREVLYFFDDEETDVARLDELAERIYQRELELDRSPSHAEVLTKLHHVHLPKLEAAGCVRYDEEANRIEYREMDLIEDLLSACRQLE